MAKKPPLYPHVPKSRKTPDSEERQRVTTMADRFTIDCSFCGFITTERTYAAAMEAAQRLKLHHMASGEKITIFDRLAQRGACNTWDINGLCIGYKEWR